MGELINGRTPEEIITGLKCEVPCSKCAYREHNFMKDDSCSAFVERDILALIERLESERDAALAKVPRWIEDGYRGIPCVCSHCGEEAHYTSTFQEKFDYDWDENLVSCGYEEIREHIRSKSCPECGARMDAKSEEEG